jgi:hypothetical protein
MPSFRELVQGDVEASGNPFYHHKLFGQKEWLSSNKVYLKDTWVRQQGTLELIVKAGWMVELEIRSENAGHFGGSNYLGVANWLYGSPELEMDDRIQQFETGAFGDSVIQIKMYGGSALATSSEELELSSSFRDTEGIGQLSGWGRKDIGTYLFLAPRPAQQVAGEWVEDPNGARTIMWGDADDGCSVKLISYDYNPEEYGTAVQGDTTSFGSTGVTQQQREQARFTGTIAIQSAWENVQTFTETDEYVIIIKFDSTDQIYGVFINGVRAGGDFYDTESAVAFAASEDERIKESGLDPIYVRESSEALVNPGGVGLANPKAPAIGFAIGGSLLIVAGVILFGYLFIQATAKGASKKALGE